MSDMLGLVAASLTSPEIAVIDRLEVLKRLMGTYRLPFGTEDELQVAIMLLLKKLGIPHQREALLNLGEPVNEWSRIDPTKDYKAWRATQLGIVDFVVAGDLAIECKVAGGPAAVSNQIERYLKHEGINGLLLVTTRSTHEALEIQPAYVVATAWAKPVKVINISSGAL
jgi:hypothetical protein